MESDAPLPINADYDSSSGVGDETTLEHLSLLFNKKQVQVDKKNSTINKMNSKVNKKEKGQWSYDYAKHKYMFKSDKKVT